MHDIYLVRENIFSRVFLLAIYLAL